MHVGAGIAQARRLLKVHGGRSVTHILFHGFDDPHKLVMRQFFQLLRKCLLGRHRFRHATLARLIGRIECAMAKRVALRASLGAHSFFGLGNKT